MLHKFLIVNSETELPSTSTSASDKLFKFKTISEPHKPIKVEEKKAEQFENKEVKNATVKRK